MSRQSHDADDDGGAFAPCNPRDLAYDEAFDNAVQAVLEHPPAAHDGLTVPRDIDPDTLPRLPAHELPLPLDDPRRVFASPVPGIRLTHPGGYLQGGPGAPPGDHRAFASQFLARHDVSTPARLSQVVEEQIAHSVGLAKERMRARSEALQHNARIEKEIKTLTDQREMEVKIETRMKEDARRRRELREKKKPSAV